MGAAAQRVRGGQAAEEVGRLAVVGGAEQEMPVVWQDAVGHNLDGKLLVGLGCRALEGFLVSVVGKQRQPGDRPVESVIDQILRCSASGSRHGPQVAARRAESRKQRCVRCARFPSHEFYRQQVDGIGHRAGERSDVPAVHN